MKRSSIDSVEQQSSYLNGGLALPPFSDQPIKISGPERPWIPDGGYQGVLISHVTSRYRSSHKVEFRFNVMVQGPDGLQRVELGYFFEVGEATPPLGMGGEFKPKGHRSKLAKLLSQCQDTLGTDRSLSMKDLSKLHWQLTVSTVVSDWDGNEIPERSRYSVIRTVQPTVQPTNPMTLIDW
jgi:hypothetical protein